MRELIFILLCLLLTIPCVAGIITVDVNGPADFNNIQAAIDAANNGDVVEIQPGTYTGPNNYNIDFKGKAITVRSIDPNDPNTIDATMIDIHKPGVYVFYFHNGETSSSIVAGLTIINNDCDGILCINSSPTITHCRLKADNNSGYRGIYCQNSS